MPAADRPSGTDPPTIDDDRSPDRREHLRRPVLWTGLIEIGDTRARCSIHDISAGGARLTAGPQLRADDRIVLTIEGMREIPGRVAWRDGQMVGIEFLVGSSYVTRMIVAR